MARIRIRYDTGFPTSDAEADFNRLRRQRVLSRLAERLRGEPSDFNLMLPFEEVAQALGRTVERRVGLDWIPLDSVVGTVDRSRDFDRRFRPTSPRTRQRWARIARAQRLGEGMPPISVYRIGELHFVRDGHHRVSVARALGYADIQADVTEVETELEADKRLRLSDLPLKSHQRVFFERVPLPVEARREIELSDPRRFDELAEAVEAWGFRCMQERREFMSRENVAAAWLADEYRPVVAMLREAGLLESGTATEGYMRVAAERYHLMRTHSWDDEVLTRLQRELR